MMAYPLSLVAGLLTSLSPCVLPALPFVVGSAAQRRRGAPLALAAGLVVSFTVTGLLIASAGSVLGLSEDALRLLASGVMMVAGVFLLATPLQMMLSRWLAPLAGKAGMASATAEAERGLVGSFMAGALLGAVWSPCVGPTLGAAAGLASQAGGLLPSGIMMALFGVGAAIPLLFAAYASRQAFMRHRDRFMRHGALGKKILGITLLIVGALVVTGGDKAFEAWLLARLPDAWLNLITAL
ncbi:MAG TPA: cytochrome c biogenesis CcdA family protein [Kiritimatiellia bacterium]|nr:cytochrome c biogenesis CcdA family protein [Kiritimatiellia bacterium]